MQDPVGNCLKTFCAKYIRSTNCCLTTVGLGTVLWLRPSAIGLLVAHITQCATFLNSALRQFEFVGSSLKKILMMKMLWSSWVRDKDHKTIAYNLETMEASHAIGASELAVYLVEVVGYLVENREGTRHAAGSASELVVCSAVLVASFAAVVKKEIFEEGHEVKRDSVGLGVHVNAGQPAHHEVAVGALCGQGGDQGLGRRQHEADVVLVRGHCQGQGHQWEGGREGQAGGYTRGRERRVHSDDINFSLLPRCSTHFCACCSRQL